MTTGEKLYKLRRDKGWSQEELSMKLNVSRQTIYKWEADMVKPETENLKQLTKLFNVSYDYLLDDSKSEIKEAKVEETRVEYVKEEKPAQKIGVCDKCGRDIFSNEYMHSFEETVSRSRVHRTYCNECYMKKKEDERIRIENHEKDRRKSQKKGRILGYIFGTLALALFVVVLSIYKDESGKSMWLDGVITGILFFTFISCIFLGNNKISEIVMTVWSWGFVRWPGVIFSLSPDGILFLIAVRVIELILAFFLGAIMLFVGIIIGLTCSIFVYPFALVRSYKHPEKYAPYLSFKFQK